MNEKKKGLVPSASSCEKVMFLHLSVILFTGGGVWQIPSKADTHPSGQAPPSGQTLPLGRHPPRQTPPGQTLP